MHKHAGRRAALQIATAAVMGAVSVASAMSGSAQAETGAGRPAARGACSSTVDAVGFSDALDKTSFDGIKVGGLSAIAYDKRSRSYVSLEDRSGTEAARLFFFRDPGSPEVSQAIALTKHDGSAYNGDNFDGEGLAVLPNGNFLVSSETEPSIMIFDRKGKYVSSLAIPARLRVAPAGEATENATLEGVSVSLDGKYVYAAMEGTLTGDSPASGDSLWRRLLVYRAGQHDLYDLTRQIGYKVDAGNRIADVAAYGDGRLLVMEAAYDEAKGNTVRLYAVQDVNKATDVSKVRNLSGAPAHDVLSKKLVADLVTCPDLGATAKEPQTNPLMDNYEGLQIEADDHTSDNHGYGDHGYGFGDHGFGNGPDRGFGNGPDRGFGYDPDRGDDRADSRGNPHNDGDDFTIHIISDDNFNAVQITRVLTLSASLP